MRKTSFLSMLTLSVFLLSALALCACSGAGRVEEEAPAPSPEIAGTSAPQHTPTDVPPTHTPSPSPSPEPAPVESTKAGPLTIDVQPVVAANVKTPYMPKEDFPALDGSTANIPLGEAVYSLLTGATAEEAASDLKFYKTPQSYINLMEGSSDILFVYEPPQEIIEQINKYSGKLLFKPLGRDALVFIENKDNPVESLTQQQIIDIYTGKTTNWSQLGGSDMEIIPFQRPSSSGSQSLMEKLAVSGDTIMEAPTMMRPQEMGDLIDVLAEYNNSGNAIGYSVYYYAKNMYTQPGLKFIAVDGVLPSNSTIQSGEYPYVNDFYVVIRAGEPEDSNARKIYDWATSAGAQELVAQAGYVPVIDAGLTAGNETDGGRQAVLSKPPLNIPDDSYVVMETAGGTALLNKKLETSLYFSNKNISSETMNSLVKHDELLILSDKVVMSDEDYYSSSRLYSLKRGEYVSERVYDNIQKIGGGLYAACRRDDYNYYDIYNSDGELIRTVSVGLGTYLSTINGDLIIIGADGMERIGSGGEAVSSVKPQEAGTFQYEQYDDYYSGVISDAYYRYYDDGDWMVMDVEGSFFSDDVFLSQYYQSPEKRAQLEPTDLMMGSDDKVYAFYIIDGNYKVFRQDGKLVLEAPGGEGIRRDRSAEYKEAKNNLISFYNEEEKTTCHYDLNGKLIGWYNHADIPEDEIPESGRAFETNANIIAAAENGFYVYGRSLPQKFFCEAQDVSYSRFQVSEGEPHPEFLNYGTKDYRDFTAYKDIRLFDSSVSGATFGDYYVVYSWRYDEEADKIVDADFVMDKSGATICQPDEDDRITGGFIGNEPYIWVVSGNYTGIMNMQGEYVYKTLSPEMADD